MRNLSISLFGFSDKRHYRYLLIKHIFMQNSLVMVNFTVFHIHAPNVKKQYNLLFFILLRDLTAFLPNNIARVGIAIRLFRHD